MATGFMVARSVVWKVVHSTCAASLCLSGVTAGATEVGLAGVMGRKAILVVDGGAPHTVAPGQSVGGVRLLSLADDQAVVEFDGRKRTLRTGQLVSGAPAGEGDKVVLMADANGHYLTPGTINGSPVQFLVDTGATYVSIGASEARRLGLSASSGQSVQTLTANGQGSATRIKLDKVQVGGIVLYGVEALVQQADLPFVLLGMSYLNRTDMQREGHALTLKKRF